MRGIVQHQPMFWYPFPEMPPGPRLLSCLVAIDDVSHAAWWHQASKQFVGLSPDVNIDTSAVRWWTTMPETPG